MRGAVSFDTAFSAPVDPQPDNFDEMGHANNAVYLRWAQDIAVRHWSRVASAEMKRRWLWVVVRHEIDYREAILPGDAAVARTWLGKADGPRFDRYVDIRKPNAARPAAAVKSTWVLLDAETRKPKRVGADILEAFGVEG